MAQISAVPCVLPFRGTVLWTVLWTLGPSLWPAHLLPMQLSATAYPIPPRSIPSHPTPENAYSATPRYMTMQERLFYTPPQIRHDHCVCFPLHWSGSFNRHCGDPSAADDGADQHVCCSSTWGSIRCYFGGLCKPLHIKYKLLVIWKRCYAPFIHYFIVGSVKWMNLYLVFFLLDMNMWIIHAARIQESIDTRTLSFKATSIQILQNGEIVFCGTTDFSQ